MSMDTMREGMSSTAKDAIKEVSEKSELDRAETQMDKEQPADG